MHGNAGNGDEVTDVGAIVQAAPAPHTIIAGQVRTGDGKLWVQVMFLSAFGTFVVHLGGADLLRLLDNLRPIAEATKAGLELPRENHA